LFVSFFRFFMLTAVITYYDNIHVLPRPLVHVCSFNKDIFFGFIKCKHCIFPFVYFQYQQTVETNCALWAVTCQSVLSGYIYTGQASMDMDISMDIHAKSVDEDMDMDGKFHIHGNPAYSLVDTRLLRVAYVLLYCIFIFLPVMPFYGVIKID